MAIRAGQIIRALDFAGNAGIFDGTDEANFNQTTFTAGSTPVGTTFMAPSSGAVLIHYTARIRLVNATAQRITVLAEVREGAVIGSGTVVNNFTEDQSLEIGQTAGDQLTGGTTMPVSGLTPGATYNVRLLYKNATSVASAASIFARGIYVVPHHI